MRALLLCLLVAAPAVLPLDAQESAFRYRPERALSPGTVWRYTKSNRDGSRPWHLDLYVASPTRIEVVKWAEGASDFVEVFADLDPARAMAVVLTQWNTEKGRREPRLSARIPADGLHLTLASGQAIDVPYEKGPLHVWGFDLMSLAFLFPHLEDPAAPFEVTFLDPNRPGAGGSPFIVDRARFTPAGEESVGGVVCLKYELGGPVFGDAKGAIYLEKTSLRLQRAEHPIPTSTDWKDWKLDLAGTDTRNGIAWEKFKQGLADAQTKRRGKERKSGGTAEKRTRPGAAGAR